MTSIEEKFPDVQTPITCVHAGGVAVGRENSLEAVRKSIGYAPNVIEIDVRKSRDGVLYCHHGSIPFGILLSQFLKFFRFSTIQKLVGPRDQLEDILKEMPAGVGIYLDVKESWIAPADMALILSHCRSEMKWIQCYSYVQLVGFMKVFGKDVGYALSRPYTRLRSSRRFVEHPPDVLENSIPLQAIRYLPRGFPAYLVRRIDRHLPCFLCFDSAKKSFVPVREDSLWRSFDDPRKIVPRT